MKAAVLFTTLCATAQAFFVPRKELSDHATALPMVAEYFSFAAATIRQSRDAASVDPLHAARDFDCPGFRKEKQYFPTFAKIVNPPRDENETHPRTPAVPKFQTTESFEEAKLEVLHLQMLHEKSSWAKAVEYGASRIGQLQAKLIGTDNPEYWLS